MAEKKHISSMASGKELEKWLQEQLDATSPDVPASQPPGEDKPDPFYQEAIEGLSQFNSTREIYRQTSRINRAIQKKTGNSRKKNFFDASAVFWWIVAIFIIITVIILAFIVLRMRMGQI